MEDIYNLNRLKTQYRVRFYRKSNEDSPKFRAGTSVLSAIKDYFKDSGGGDSPDLSRPSLFADSVTNINTPENIQKKSGSANQHVSKMNVVNPAGETSETKLKPTILDVREKVQTSEEEMDDDESDMPVNLVVKKDVETPTVRSVRSTRHSLYNSNSSAMQGPASPVSKSSPQKRLRYSDALIKADKPMTNPGNKNDPRPSTAPTEYLVHKDNDEFVIENDTSINMNFYLANNKPTAGSSKTTRSAACSTTYKSRGSSVNLKALSEEPLPWAKTIQQTKQTVKELVTTEENGDLSLDTNSDRNKILRSQKSKAEKSKSSSVTGPLENQKLQHKDSEQSPYLTRRSQSAKKKNSSNMNKKDTADESENLSSDESKDTKLTPLRATYRSRSSFVKSKAEPKEPLAYLQAIHQTKQTVKELETTEENGDLSWDTNCDRIKIPRSQKSKAEKSESSSVSNKKLETDSESDPEEIPVQSQTVNTLINPSKDALAKHKTSFKSRLAKITNIEPPVKRMENTEISDIPVVDKAEEFVIKDSPGKDLEDWDKKMPKMINKSKKTKKKQDTVPETVHNVTYTKEQKSCNNVAYSGKRDNDSIARRYPLKDSKKKEKRTSELERLAVYEYFQTSGTDLNGSTSSRSKRVIAPPSNWWVVNQGGINTTFDVEKVVPQYSPKSKKGASSKLGKPLKEQENEKEGVKLKNRRLVDQDEENTLSKIDELSSETFTTRKRTRKLKSVESEEFAEPSNVKRPKSNKAHIKSQTSEKKSLRSKRTSEQLESEAQENIAESSHEHDVSNLPNKIDDFPSILTRSKSERLAQQQTPISNKHFKTSSPSENYIHPDNLEECDRTEKREPQPHNRLSQESSSTPTNDSKLTFQSGPLLRSKALRCNKQMDSVVRNLTSAGGPLQVDRPTSLNIVDVSPMTIILNPDTNKDAIAECVCHADNERQDDSLIFRCFNNRTFSAGKLVLKEMEVEMRDIPDNDILVFYIVRGEILLRLHKSFHNLKTGDFFYIPPGNTYHIQNLEKQDVELVYTQLKP